jgi:hypothetical protein
MNKATMPRREPAIYCRREHIGGVVDDGSTPGGGART